MLVTGVCLEPRTRKLLIFLGTLFVAISFISSYAAFGNNSGVTSIATTTVNQATHIGFGTTNGVISGYSQSAVINLNTSLVNSSSANIIINTLLALETNGSVTTYSPQTNSSFDVYLSTINAYDLQKLLHQELGSNTSTSVNASSYVKLPASVSLYIGSQEVSVPFPTTNQSVSIVPMLPIGNSVMLKVRAAITNNGTITQLSLNPV